MWREKGKVRIFGKGKCKLIANCEFLARESVNSSPILARQWWRHFRLCLSVSLSLSPKVPHAQCRKRFRASYNTERERERDGSDVTLIALKLSMSFVLLLAKMCTLVLAKSFAPFLAKNFHLFIGIPSWMALSSHFPLPNTLHSSKQFAFFVASVKWRHRGSKHRNKGPNIRLHRPSHRKNKSN